MYCFLWLLFMLMQFYIFHAVLPWTIHIHWIRCVESILKSRYSKHMVKIREKVNAVVLHPWGWGVKHGGRHCCSVSIYKNNLKRKTNDSFIKLYQQYVTKMITQKTQGKNKQNKQKLNVTWHLRMLDNQFAWNSLWGVLSIW